MQKHLIDRPWWGQGERLSSAGAPGGVEVVEVFVNMLMCSPGAPGRWKVMAAG